MRKMNKNAKKVDFVSKLSKVVWVMVTRKMNKKGKKADSV